MDFIRIIKNDTGSMDQACRHAVAVLRRGGVVMHATETCYGLAADIFNKQALKRLYSVKKMEKMKPVSIMVKDLDEAQKFALFNKPSLRLARAFWPGPLTLIVPVQKTLPAFLNSGQTFVGIRCPDSDLVKKLLTFMRNPLTTTSANLSGLPETYNVQDFLNQLDAEDMIPDLIIDSGKMIKNPPSTIVKIDGKKVHIIREGILHEKVLEFLG